jgi:preprotein translocase subunit SecG
MRYIGLILALGIVGWVLYQAAGGGKAETAIPAGYQKSLDTAKGVEQSLQDATKQSLEEAEDRAGTN